MAKTFEKHPSNKYEGPRDRQSGYFSPRRFKLVFQKIDNNRKLSGSAEKRLYRSYLASEFE